MDGCGRVRPALVHTLESGHPTGCPHEVGTKATSATSWPSVLGRTPLRKREAIFTAFDVVEHAILPGHAIQRAPYVLVARGFPVGLEQVYYLPHPEDPVRL